MYPELDYGLVIGVAECRRWPYQTGKTLKVHIQQNIQCGNVSVMVSYPKARARLDKILVPRCACTCICKSMYLRLGGITPCCCCCYCFNSHNDRNCCFCFCFYSNNAVLKLAQWDEGFTSYCLLEFVIIDFYKNVVVKFRLSLRNK